MKDKEDINKYSQINFRRQNNILLKTLNAEFLKNVQ
jgi:hypothetical protein